MKATRVAHSCQSAGCWDHVQPLCHLLPIRLCFFFLSLFIYRVEPCHKEKYQFHFVCFCYLYIFIAVLTKQIHSTLPVGGFDAGLITWVYAVGEVCSALWVRAVYLFFDDSPPRASYYPPPSFKRERKMKEPSLEYIINLLEYIIN